MSNSHVDLAPRPLMALDGDADDSEMLRLLLRKAGVDHPLQVFRRGEEMLAALSAMLTGSAALLPLICFLELGLPDMSGFEVMRSLRQNSGFDGVSLVVMSASEDPGDVDRAAQAGAQCYLTKYPQPAVLRQIVQEAKHFADDRPASHWFGICANHFLRWGGHDRPGEWAGAPA